MMNVLKLGCVGLYLVALASLFVALPISGDIIRIIQWVAAFLLVTHAAEVLIFFNKVKLYRGPLLHSVILTILFGFGHWLPLAQAEAKANAN